MILALPMVAILKVILDHSEQLKAFGYVLGDPGSVEDPPALETRTEAEADEENEGIVPDTAVIGTEAQHPASYIPVGK